MSRLTRTLMVVGCVGIAAAAAAQDPPAAENKNAITRLDNITALTCTFPVSSIGAWARGSSSKRRWP